MSRIDRHHLLEIILWPNEDGTFRTIHNSAARLKELGIYNDYKMTIPLTRSEHSALHSANRCDETKRKISESNKGKNTWTKDSIPWNKGMSGEYHHRNKRKFHNLSDDHKTKIGRSNLGKKRSSETIANMKITAKKRGSNGVGNLPWWTDGKKNVRSLTCPEGFHRGLTYAKQTR